MKIDETLSTVRKNNATTQVISADVWYTTDEETALQALTEYSEGSIAYCYDGASKGTIKIFDGESWVAQ